MGYPTFLNHSPQKDFIGAILEAPIFFRIDDEDGLNISTLNVLIESIEAVKNGVFQNGFTGVITNENNTPTALSILIIRTANWTYSQEVNVNSEIENLLGTNGKDYYNFITIPNPDITAPLVVASPHGGVYNSTQSVSLTSDESNVTIHYTLDGTKPTLSSPVYSSPINISNEGLTKLRFVGIDENNNYDKIRIEEYNLDTVVPTTTANPIGGNFYTSLNVKLSSDDPNATIFFTTNGLEPTTSSTIYTTPISIPDNESTTLKFFSIDTSGNIENVKREVYNVEIAKNNIKVYNVSVRHAYVNNELEINWDDMYPKHTNIIGYNIYRSHVEQGPYNKLNNNLITITQYIDKTLDTEIIKEDVSEQFRRTVNISRDINDDFSGSTYDVTKWKETDVGQLLFQYNGIIFTDKVGLIQESKITSKFKFKGNFDIQIDYNLPLWVSPASTIISQIFRIKRDDNNFIQVARQRSQTSNVYSSNKFVNGNPDLPTTVSTIDEQGKYKIKRVGNVITTYFYDNNAEDWILIGSYNFFTEDLYVEIVGQSGDVAVEMRWNLFKVNSGTPIIIQPLNQLKEYVIQVARTPVVDSTGTNKQTDNTNEVQVTINGQRAYIRRLEGFEGVIFLETDKVYDEVTKTYFTPPVPNEHSTVLVTYKTCLHTTKTNLVKNYFYKVTVVTNEDETDLGVIEPEYLKTEKISWIFEEAMRRNSWLRDQAGERVLLFIKKTAGELCECVKRGLKGRTHVKADKDCHNCYGTQFVGGYYGPINIIIGNLTSERSINQTERGLKLQNQVETWTGNFPLISQRDMIVRRNGDRLLVGPITPVEGPGGVIIQQHFVIEVLDATDIRYDFPIQPLPNQYTFPSPIDKKGCTIPEISSPKEREELSTNWDTSTGDDVPDVPSKKHDSNKQVDAVKRGPDQEPRRGRSIKFENINF